MNTYYVLKANTQRKRLIHKEKLGILHWQDTCGITVVGILIQIFLELWEGDFKKLKFFFTEL